MMFFALFALTVVVNHSFLRPYFKIENFPPRIIRNNKRNSILRSFLELKLDALAGKPDLKRQIGSFQKRLRNEKKEIFNQVNIEHVLCLDI